MLNILMKNALENAACLLFILFCPAEVKVVEWSGFPRQDQGRSLVMGRIMLSQTRIPWQAVLYGIRPLPPIVWH